jgi:hypothetical protein
MGSGSKVADWRAWLSSPDSKQLHDVVPDGYYDNLVVNGEHAGLRR